MTHDVYQCLQCAKNYVITAGMILRCPYCQSKEREEVGRIPDVIELLNRLLNAEGFDTETILDELRGPERCDTCRAPATITLSGPAPDHVEHFCSECWRESNRFPTPKS